MQTATRGFAPEVVNAAVVDFEESQQVIDSQTQTQTQTQTYSPDEEWTCEPVAAVRAWGRLHVITPSSVKRLGCGPVIRSPSSSSSSDTTLSVDLINDQFIVGRAMECNYSITNKIVTEKVVKRISKEHFILTRDLSQILQPTILHDLSANGTFINGKHVGKGNKHILTNEDVIAINDPSINMFVYADLHKNDDNSIPKKVTDKYYVSRVLGSGACGIVKLVYNKSTCQKYAMKIITKKYPTNTQRAGLNDPKKVTNEINILKSLRHPCIIRTEETLDTNEAVFITMEYMEGGELFDLIAKNGKLTDRSAKIVFRQILIAVKHLHDEDIIHRDLKPENILLESTDIENSLVKLTDFGLSKFLDGETFMKTMCGTPLYVAPEVLLSEGRETYSSQVDVWSLGVILFICLSGYLPFSEQHQYMPLREQIIRGRIMYSKQHWAPVDPSARKLVLQMLTTDPKKRISVEEIFKSAWLQDEDVTKKVEDLMKKSEICLSVPSVKRQLSEVQRLIDPIPKKIKILCEKDNLKIQDDDTTD